MRIAFGFGLAVLIAACGGHAAAPTTPPPTTTTPTTTDPVATTPAPSAADCTTAVSAMMDQMVSASKGELDALAPEKRAAAEAMIADKLPKLKAVTTEACTLDKWSPAAIACVGSTRTEADFDKCGDLLTAEQKQHAQERIGKVMGEGAPDAAATPTPPAP